MPHTKTPWTDELSINQSSAPIAEAITAPALLPEVANTSAVVVGVANDALTTIVDPAKAIGDVLTLIDPLTGEAGFAPPTGGGGSTFTFFQAAAVPVPGSNTPVVFTINHGQNAFPKDVRLYLTKLSGEVKQIEDLYSFPGNIVNWSISSGATGIENTLNTYNVAVFQIPDLLYPAMADLTVELDFA